MIIQDKRLEVPPKTIYNIYMKNKEVTNPNIHVINILTKAFKDFNKQFCEDKLPIPVITVQSKGRRNAYGWFWAGGWSQKDGDDRYGRPEINISAELLGNRPLEDVFETLLHEMAHMWNWREGIKDCSAGQYHNKNFKTKAELLGLEVSRMENRGWASTKLSDLGKKVVKKFIEKYNIKPFAINRTSSVRPTEDVYAVPVFGDTKEFAVLKAEELGVTQKALLRALVNKFGHHLTANDVEGEVA